MNEQILGLITGFLFGYILQRGRVIRFEKQIGALLFRDMTILKFMLSAIIVGTIGLYLLKDAGLIELKHKAMNLGAVVVGGGLFGLGWAICGFCPATSIGAMGEGRWHAAFAALGMIVGAAIYAELYPLFLRTILSWKDWGKISLVDIIGIHPWIIIIAAVIVYCSVFALFEKKKI